jgi:hypothetical protein
MSAHKYILYKVYLKIAWLLLSLFVYYIRMIEQYKQYNYEKKN